MSLLHYHAHTEAPREVVWDVLADHAGMSRWMSRVWRSRLLRRGDDAPNGLGAIRAVITLAGPVHERIVAFEPPQHLEYRMEPEHPLVRDYRGAVELTRMDSRGTDIHWTVSFRARRSWLEPVIRPLVRLNTKRFASDLSRASAERAARTSAR